MYAEKKLIEWLLFENKESNVGIARNTTISEGAVRNLRKGDAIIDEMRFNNAYSLTCYAEKKLQNEDSDTSEKIEELLKQFSEAGHEISLHELIKKMTDNYYELARGNFIDLKK